MSVKKTHEFRDPIYGFITCSSMERNIIDSLPFQRLRHIHQLAMTYLLYPGATHRRFEHSLGVMHLATRVYNVIINNIGHLPDIVVSSIPELNEDKQRDYWLSTLRMAALLHDVGHLPFSHAGEKELLPDGCTHETMTWRIITSPKMEMLLEDLQLKPKVVAKLAVGQKDLPKEANTSLSTWETLLSEIIVGDAFGVDRMDYLLRDSHHLGVSYGHFDLDRVINSIRIGFRPPDGEGAENQSAEPLLGVDESGIHAATALLWARFSLFSQVYFHHVRRIYDIHYLDFLKAYFKDGFSIDTEDYLNLTDNEILMYMSESARNPESQAHQAAKILMERGHFRLVYRETQADRGICLKAADRVAAALIDIFKAENIRVDSGSQKHKNVDFPVVYDTKCLMASQEMPNINSVPIVNTGYVFVAPEKRDAVKGFLLDSKIQNILLLGG